MSRASEPACSDGRGSGYRVTVSYPLAGERPSERALAEPDHRTDGGRGDGHRVELLGARVLAIFAEPLRAPTDA
jgi:hypothetical protein